MASAFPQDPANILHDNPNSDTVDGFRRFLRKKFARFTGSRFSKNRKEKPSDEFSSKELLDSTENKTKQKQSHNEFDWDDNEYDFSHPKRGLAIIINNEDFSKCPFLDNRLGSSEDASALYNSLRLLGFDVEWYNDLEAWKMVEVLNIATMYYDHGASDCFVCAVLTHGIDVEEKLQENPSAGKVVLDILFGVDGTGVTVKYLVETFNDTYCPALKDKPRLFFLQACRGKKCDDGQTILVKKSPLDQCGDYEPVLTNKDLGVKLQEESSLRTDKRLQNRALDKRDVLEDADDDDDEDEDSNSPVDSEGNAKHPAVLYDKRDALWHPSKDPLPRPACSHNDFLIMYAAPPGHTAWRHEEDGSWFIQTLCKILNGVDLTSTSLLRALTKVNGVIARDFESQNEDFPQKKGLAVIESKLLKDIFIPKKTMETAL